MAEKTWLYLYENRPQKRLYIGVGNRMDRVWQDHNAEAEDLRETSGTQILQTIEPFSSRADALKAEAIAIHVAMLSGVTVYNANDGVSVDDGQVQVTNRAGTESTKALGPAVSRREGEIEFESLSRTAIVTIATEEMNERPGPYGGNAPAMFSERARKVWTVGAAKQPHIERLIAILKGSSGLILGDWDVDPEADYGPDNNIFPLIDPAEDDIRGTKGKRLTGVQGQQGRIYSLDLRQPLCTGL